MNLEQIQEMWEKDSHIDPDNLHDESLKIPQLHSKYYTVYNTITLMREKARNQYNEIRLERHNYYTGKAPQQVYAEKPFNLKILKTDIDKYMESDDELVKLKSKVEYIQTVIDFLDSTIKQISNRGFQIKNAIDWRKFTSGAI